MSLAVWHMYSNDMSVVIWRISVIFHKKIERKTPNILNKRQCMNKSPCLTSSVISPNNQTYYAGKDKEEEGARSVMSHTYVLYYVTVF